jgi:isoamylase
MASVPCREFNTMSSTILDRPQVQDRKKKSPGYAHRPGLAHPLGATPDKNGVNFTVFSRNATGVELLLFEKHDDVAPVQVIKLDPEFNRKFFFWHVYVEGLRPGAHYAYRVDGPQDLHGKGFRFNRNKVLIDPYALGNTDTLLNRADACGPEDNVATSMRSMVIDLKDYDWEGDRPVNWPMSDSIIYEMHVRGFTRDPSSGVQHPGTFAGVIEKIPYLKELGVTAVELLPVMEFDAREVLREKPDGSEVLTNYWGYSTIGFFAPEGSYCVSPEEGTNIREFRDMVKALHKAGIGVELDIVFNHTNEGNHLGPTFNFKGFDNDIYYHLVEADRQYYMDYSGCGNTVNCNHPIVNKFIVECLEFWVKEMHVDGFRFDEGSILSRGEDGTPMLHPPVVWAIELSETLLDTKVIAEAWDAAGLYQIGYFPGYRWAEWDGRFRDDVRRFVKGDPGLVGAVANRIAGSADIYQASGHLPINSLNFVTCHDGFTLNDLVSYNAKHNEANGEGNRDGSDDNMSWNCGVEGPTDDPAIEALRNRQVKNFAALLLLSQGVPMMLMGDEVRQTQRGNNNAYCQDNDISWFDWKLVKKHAGLFRFWKRMIDFRKRHPAVHRSRFFDGKTNERGLADLTWHGTRLGQPDWHDPGARVLAFTLAGFGGDADIHVMLNMYWEALEFQVPPVKGRKWQLAVDTAKASPLDIADPGQELPLTGNTIHVMGHSTVVLLSR